MNRASKDTKVIEIRTTERSEVFNGRQIEIGNFVAYFQDEIVASDKFLGWTLGDLKKIIPRSIKLVDIYFGEDVAISDAKELFPLAMSMFPEAEVQILLS